LHDRGASVRILADLKTIDEQDEKTFMSLNDIAKILVASGKGIMAAD